MKRDMTAIGRLGFIRDVAGPLSVLVFASVLLSACRGPASAADVFYDAPPEPEVQSERREETLASRSVARLAEQASRMIPRHEYDDALYTIYSGLEIDPTYMPLWRLKALAHIELGQNEEAEEALDVCLLRNRADIDANVLSLMNAIRRPDISDTERASRIAARIDEMDLGLFAAVLERFMGRDGFPRYLSTLLSGWHRTNSPLDRVKETLRLFSGGQIDAVRTRMSGPAARDIEPKLKAALEKLLARATEDNGRGVWVVDRGTLAANDDGVVLSAGPRDQAFAWLELSPGWKNAEAVLGFDLGDGAPRHLYLRYESNESYLRIGAADATLVVQERVPGYGLTTIFEYPLALLESPLVSAILKGERLTLSSGDVALSDSALPISNSVRQGRAAISVDNHASDGSCDAVFAGLKLRRLDNRWQTLAGGLTTDEAAGIFADPENSGVLVLLDADPKLNAWVSPLLLSAANSGVDAFARLPDGSVDLELLFASLGRLPKILAERIWKGVVFAPGENADWTVLAEALADASERGLQTGLILDPGKVGELATHSDGIRFDWALFLDAENAAPASLRALTTLYVDALYKDGEAEGRFSSSIP